MDANNKEISYFKIGTFVLVGLGLIIFTILIFGSSKLFQSVVYVETYFNESIQGISEGTPVKYRGLQIGYIDDIGFTSEFYQGSDTSKADIHSRSIYVKIAITSKLFTNMSVEGVQNYLATEVSQGLRVKLVAQGLTGISYLEFDYVDPQQYPIPKLSWAPKFFYVPSVISTLTRLSENAQYIMNELKDVDFKEIFSHVDKLALSLTKLSNRTENILDEMDNSLAKTIQNFKVISDDLRDTSARVKMRPSELIFSSPPPRLDPNKL